MPELLHQDDIDPRGPDFGKPTLGQSLRAIFIPDPKTPTLSKLMASSVKQVPASTANYTAGRLGYSIRGIIIHTMVGTLASCDTTFQNPARGASAHYGIPYNGYNDGPIHQYVSEGNIAWHCGRYYPDAGVPFGNTNTIGIEHADNGAYNSPRPDALYEATSQLVREICNRYHIPINRTYIRKHREVSVNPTGCPDTLNIDRIVAMAAGAAPAPPVITTGDDEDMLYVGPLHAKAATFKAYVSGHSYRERTPNSPANPLIPIGTPIVVTGYCYSTAPVQSANLGGGVSGPDYLWWQADANHWVPDAILDTSGLVGAPGPTIPDTEPLDTLFATQTQVKAITAGTVGPPGKQGDIGPKGDTGAASTIPGPKGDKGDKGDAGVIPDHKHDITTTGPML